MVSEIQPGHIFQLKVTTARSMVKSRLHHDEKDKMGVTWEVAEKIVKNIKVWHDFVLTLCSTWFEEDKMIKQKTRDWLKNTKASQALINMLCISNT